MCMVSHTFLSAIEWDGKATMGEIEREKCEELRVDFEKREAWLPSP